MNEDYLPEAKRILSEISKPTGGMLIHQRAHVEMYTCLIREIEMHRKTLVAMMDEKACG